MMMKLPTITMPKWWKPWYGWQLVTLAFLISNVVWPLLFPSWFSPVNWFLAGIMFAQFFSNHIIYGMIASNRRLMRAVNEIGQLQTEEIGKQIAAEMNARMTGDPDAPPLAPTKH